MSQFDFLTETLELVHRPSQREPWLEIQYTEPENIHKFIELVNTLSNLSQLSQHRLPILFRGQAKSEWRLEPKIYRLVKNISKEDALRMEFDSITYFKQQARVFLSSQLIPNGNNLLAWLALMQHYAAPTRMLDWTGSFNVALYFAVADQPLEEPGAVWFFEVQKLVNSMAKYETLPESERKHIFSNQAEFADFGCNRARPNIVAYDMDVKPERTIAQQSILTFSEELFCDHSDLIGKALIECFESDKKTLPLCKIVVPPRAKTQLREYLNKLNVCAATLFPGADGVGRAISEIIQVRCDVVHH